MNALRASPKISLLDPRRVTPVDRDARRKKIIFGVLYAPFFQEVLSANLFDVTAGELFQPISLPKR